MRFTIQREAFLKPLKAVAGVVERRNAHALPIISHVLIVVQENHFTLTTTDQEVELIANGELEQCIEKGAITVPFRKLMDLCRALPEGVLLSIAKEEDRVIIRAGKSRFALSSLPADQFPSLDSNIGEHTFLIAKKTLRHLIDNTSFAMADQDVRYYLNGLLVEIKAAILYCAASDGHRLAVSSAPLSSSENKTLRIIVPRKGVLELQRILDEGEEQISLIIGANHLRAITDTVTLTTKLLEGKFPDYERIIPLGGSKEVLGIREILKEAFLRAATLFSDKFRGVRLQLAPGRLKILATNAEQDEVEEDLEVEYQGEELEIGFNAKYLIDLLSVIQTEVVRFTFSDANNSARVEGVGEESGIYVIMPMRI
jgi:DNA polymerase III subunit beta